MPQISRDKVITGCVIAGAVAVVGGVVLWKIRRRKQVEEEDLHFPSQQTHVAQGKQSDQSLEQLANDLLSEAPSTNRKFFSELGVSLQVPNNWEAGMDELSLMGPQLAVIRVTPPGFEKAAPGELPNITIIVEDIARDHMTLLEYKEKSKEFATSQPLMIQAPQVTKDEPISLGRFQHVLEYTQVFPGPQMVFTPLKFMNLMTLHKDLAYVVQYMARTDKFNEYLDEAKRLASTLVIEDLPSRLPSRIEYINAAHKIKCSIPETWSVQKESRGASELPEAGGKSTIVSFQTNSVSKPDSVILCKLATSQGTAQELAQKVAALLKGSCSEITTKQELAHFSCPVGEKTSAFYCSTDYFVETRADGERVTTPTVTEEDVCRVLKSLAPVEADTSSIRYVNEQSRFSFQLTANSRLLEHKWGSVIATYSPVQVDENSEQSVPIFTVEVNKDEECLSLQAIEERLMMDADPSMPLREKTTVTLRGRQYLSFVTSREEALQGPFGPREEVKVRLCITVRGEESVVLKWEVAANEWLRYERFLNPLLESFELYD